MKYLLDTNVFREIGKTDPHPHVAAWLRTVAESDLAISALTVREVRKGIVRLRARKRDVADQIERRVREAFAMFGSRVLPITRQTAELWGELLGHSDKHVDDMGLAATAKAHALTLVTRNVRHMRGRSVTTLDPFRPVPRVAKP